MATRMIEDGMLSNKLDITQGYLLTFYCPGCKHLHSIGIEHPNNKQAKWGWDRNVDKPTFTPSVLVRMPWLDTATERHCCHSYIRNGKFEYLSDCTHELAGKVVDMVPIPDNL